MTTDKKTQDLKDYMKTYRESLKTECKICGGKYNQYTQEKHEMSAKHLKKAVASGAGKAAVFDEELNKEDISKWLAERFKTTVKEGSSEYNKTPRVDKTSTIWRKLAEAASSLKYQSLLNNRLDLVKKVYKTPSSQQSALSALKIVLDHVHPLGDLKQKFFEEGKALSEKYVAETELKEDGMSYDELKKLETVPNKTIALFAHLYAPDMPALRLSDWVNATVGKNKNMNEIILSKGLMRRRISKNMGEPEDIHLSKGLIKFIKKEKIKGALFGDMALQEIVNLIGKTLGAGNGSRYWRQKYVTEIVSKMSGKEKVKVASEMNHSIGTATLIYDRQKSTAKAKIVKL